MNILFLMKVFEVGGQEVVTNTLAQCFLERGHQVAIASFKKPSTMMAGRVDKRIRLYTIGDFRYSRANVEKVADIIHENAVDVVINQWGLPFVPARVLLHARKRNEHKYQTTFKTIAVYHNSPDTNARIKEVELAIEGTSNGMKKGLLHLKRELFKAITSLSMRYVYRVSDIYQVLSASFVSSFQSFTGIRQLSKLMVQINPVTIDASSYVFDASRKQKEILYVGRIDYNQKRVYRVIDTWAALEKRFPDWKLTIVGDGPSRTALEKQVSELQLKHVTFEGFQQPAAYYERASLLLLTSEYEGFPLVLAECMSFGVVPAVYGSYSAVHDIVTDHANGLVLPYDEAGYDSSLMAQKMAEVMENSEKYEQMALAAIATSKHYSLDAIYNSWNHLFLQLKG